MAQSGRARGSLEAEVLAALAASRRPLSVQDVLDELGTDLAYTTVMTTLSRLHAKNAIEREQAGRAYRYTLPRGGARGAKSSMTAHQMHRLLEGGDRRMVLSRFLAELGPDDEKLLRRLLDEDAAPSSTRSKPSQPSKPAKRTR